MSLYDVFFVKKNLFSYRCITIGCNFIQSFETLLFRFY